MNFFKKKPKPYPDEDLDPDSDDGTMPENVADLAKGVIGHKIVKVVERARVPQKAQAYGWRNEGGLEITLDNGHRVYLVDTASCCAYTELESFLLHPEMVDHVITGVGTTDGYDTWHIYADLGDVLELNVKWSCGNPFYYGYGFNITVVKDPYQ